MPTLAELDVRVNSAQIERGTKALNDLAAAAKRAAEAAKIKSTADLSGDESARKSTKATSDATKEYDLQAKKLRELAEARKKLEDSNMKNTDPEKYKRELAAIDATVGKLKLQGNAQEQLQAKWDAMEEASRRASERQKSNIDGVISGLSRQAKAQIDYNRTLEDLNRAKGLGAGKVGGIGEAEYESYKKLAQAQRDNALAAIDNSKEMARAQAQIDSVASTLGKAEKAQYLYAQRVKQITEASKLLGLTEQQVTALIDPHTRKLQEQLAVINSNGAAQEKFATQLRNLINAYDPVIKANETYKNSVQVLIQGMIQGKLTIEQYNGAMTQLSANLERVKAAQPNSEQSQAKRYQDALDRLLPYNVQLRNLEAAEKALNAAQAQGRVTTEAQIAAHNKAKEAIAAERAEVDRLTAATDRRGNSAKQNAAALRGLPAQFTDVVVSLQGGQAPLTVLLQQGGQVKDMFGGVAEAFKAVGGALYAMITPTTVAAAGLAAFGLAMYQAQSETHDFNKAVAASANYSGLSSSEFLKLQQSIYAVTGSAGQAAEAMTLLQLSGKVTAENFEAITIAAVKLNRVTGQAIKDTANEFISLGKDPASAVLSLNDKYNFLTSAVYNQIASLQAQGETQAAVTLAQSEMAKGAEAMADRIKPQLGLLETGWHAVRDAAKGAWDAILNVGREDDLDKQLAHVANQIDEFNNGLLSKLSPSTRENSPALRMLLERQERLEAEKVALDENTISESENTKAKKAAVAAEQALQSSFVSNRSPVRGIEAEIARVTKQYTLLEKEAERLGTTVTKKQADRQTALLVDLAVKLKDAQEAAARKGAPKSRPVDTTALTEMKVGIDAIEREYTNYYKKITALGSAGVVSQEATVAAQIAILNKQKEAANDAYGSQIDAIKKLQATKGNNAAQTISLDNQLLKAQDAQLKSQENLDAKMEELKVKEQGRLEQRANNIKSYADALKASVDNIEEQGRRQVAALARGDRQGKVDADQAANGRNYAKGMRDLADKKQTMDPVEYAAKLDVLKKSHDDMSSAILKNDANIKAAEADWTNGVSKAYENYIDESSNLAGLMGTAVSNAFQGMEDSLTNFVMTGKADFSSLATSIIADLARIAVKMAASQALQSLVGAGIAAYSGYSGTSGGTMSGFSETTGGNYYPQAKGGAWSGGTQFFAKGGAFTNSVVNSPTSFAMSGGGQGIMGEAGPEAIVPLSRSSDGSLGVRMSGSSSTTSDGMQVNIYISDSGGVSAEASGGDDTAMTKEFGRQVGEIAAAKYHELLKRDLSDGGAIKTSIAGR